MTREERQAADKGQTTLAKGLDQVEKALDEIEGTHHAPDGAVWASKRQKGDFVVAMGKSRYPLPSQEDGWKVPNSVRLCALATLWRIIRSPKVKAIGKVRAIEALVRIDNQALQEVRHDDWKVVQSDKSRRSNVRALAELASQPKLSRSG